MDATPVIETEEAVVAAPDATEAPGPTTAAPPLNLLDDIVAKLRTLPPIKQMEVRDFVKTLMQDTATKQPRWSAKGMLSHLGLKITEEDITAARREMWGNFPREID